MKKEDLINYLQSIVKDATEKECIKYLKAIESNLFFVYNISKDEIIGVFEAKRKNKCSFKKAFEIELFIIL